MRRILLSLSICVLLVGAYFGFQRFHRPSNTPLRDVATPLPVPQADSGWSIWGGALNSAAQDGSGFFESQRADRFFEAVPESERRYVIHLVSRAFLPERGCTAFDGRHESTPVLAYLQFHDIPDAKERAALAADGVSLERYVAGNSWRVRASVGELRKLAARATVRSITEVDPRDKLHPSFWFESAPDYARSNGDIQYSVLASDPNSFDQAFPFKWFKWDVGSPSVLGSRINVRVPDATVAAEPKGYREIALLLARSVDVLYVEPPTPPVVSRDTVGKRDATTDDQSNVSDVRDNGLLLTGAGIIVSVREIGRPNAHIDFSSRLTEVETNGATDAGNRDHATQVHGQVAGQGFNNPTAKGIAPAALLRSYSVGNAAPFETVDVTDAKNAGSRISNHSYGPSGGSLRFGTYESVSADWDAALRANNQLGFFAGAEIRNDPAPFFKQDYFVGAKNTILISSTNSAAHAGDDSPARTKADGLADFSLFGPMNDGRIKPDLMAFGDGVTLTTGPNGEAINFGTSFSTPAASGMAALLLQHYRSVTNTEPSAAMLKALLCNTASDLGQPGPDAQYGFGLINIENAANIVSLGVSPVIAPFREGTIGGLSSNGNLITIPVQVDSPSQLRATLCWFDPAGDPSAAKPLVNDLNLTLISPTGTVFFPFSLNKNSPSNPATAIAPNTVDPIEQIVVDAQVTGTWLIQVSGIIPTGSQDFALVFNRPPTVLPVTADILASPKSGVAPLLVSFQAGAFDLGANATYAWDFGDGSLGSGFTVTHTYQSPGLYTVMLTVTAGAIVKTDTETILVTRREVPTFPKKLQLNMKFGVATAPDDSLQFSVVIPELVQTPQQAREALRDGTYEGVSYKVFINNGAAPLATVLLNRRAQFKDRSLQFSINLTRGEVTAKFKKIALESVLNLSSTSKAEDLKFVDVRLENEDTVYTATLPVEYKPANGRGTGKYPFKK